MKKIYMLAASLFIAGAVSAQTIADGGFQSMFVSGAQLGINSTNVGAYVTPPSTINWLVVGGNETANPITASQSASAISVSDTAAQSVMQASNQEVSGLIEQVYEGSFDPTANSTNMNFTYKYKYSPVGTDTAMVRVMVIDTNVTANSGVLWIGVALIPDAAATSTNGTISTWQDVQAGTPNMMLVDFVSSYGAFMDDTPAPVGSKLTIDDVTLTVGNVSVNNVSNIESKVFPNPVSDVLNIELTNAEATSVSIYNVDGSLVKTEVLNGVKGSVNVSNLTAGLYIYRVATNNGEVKATFVKK